MKIELTKTVTITLSLSELAAIQRWLDCNTKEDDTTKAISVFKKIVKAASNEVVRTG